MRMTNAVTWPSLSAENAVGVARFVAAETL